MRKVRSMLACAAAAAMLAVSMGGAPAQAAAGGPVVLMGIDAEDGGSGGHGPPANYAQVVNSMLANVSNSGSGILVISNGGYVPHFWNGLLSHLGGTTVTHTPNATTSFTGFKMVVVSSDYNNTYGGITPAQNDQLTARKADFASFVNGGGALLGFTSDWYGASTSYGYIADVGAVTANTGLSYVNINPTTDGTAIGVTDALDVCCWHDEYLTYPSFLKVLATNAGTGRAAAIGNINVVISDIQLTPASQTGSTGTSQTVTATVKENGTPIVGTTVTFTAVSGPNAGVLGTAVTDASGVATFAYTSTSAGADSIEASFLDSTGVTQTSNRVLVEWEVTNRAPLVSAGGPYTGDEGSALTLTGSASDPDGDAVSLQWTYMAGSGVDTGATCTFGSPTAATTTFSCTDNGDYHVKLTGTDTYNVSSDSVAVSVLANVAPVIGTVTAPADPVALGTAAAVSASFTDNGANDTHTCTIDWGDGTATAGAVTGGSCAGSHTYAAPGIYTVAVTVTDDDGASDTEIYQYVVVYDPNGGFVTGGGWINSPAGAYAADPTLSGKANFGFVSKYKKGTTVPDGQTQFQFHAAGFNFHSTVYEWLVVSGSKAQYKGSGTVNGAGDYGFMLTANDGAVNGGGDVDKFRIKVWDKASGAVVYDNQLGDADDAAATTALGGGSIVIHTKK